MVKSDLHLTLYSAMGGISFVGLLAVPELKQHFEFDWMYEVCLALFVLSSMTFATFVLARVIATEKKMELDDAIQALNHAKEDDVKVKEKEFVEAHYTSFLFEKKLDSGSAKAITQVALWIFVLAFLSLVFALSLQVFMLTALALFILFVCVKKFIRSPRDEFLS